MRKVSSTAQTGIAMIIGIPVGIFFGKDLLFLGKVSQALVFSIKTLSGPLLFFAITDGFLKAEFKGKGFLALLFVSALNATCAVALALGISNLFKPGEWLKLSLPTSSGFSQKGNWLERFSNEISFDQLGEMLTGTTLVILISLFTGLSLYALQRLFGKSHTQIFYKASQLSSAGLKLVFRLIDWLILLLPAAVFCAVVKAIGTSGLSVAGGLLAYFLACGLGMLLHILICYQSWIHFFGKIGLKRFWKEASEPAVYAFGINSSLATLPHTLKALDRLKVSPSSSRLSACIGTNFNNDGILLYEVVAALFLIQAYGISLALPAQLLVALISVIACIGVAGIPEAGIISLTIVLSSIGLPAEAIPFLLTIDWVLARMRSFTNVLGDITVAIAIDRLTSEGRFLKGAKVLN
ncbi:MAG: dicarboxylate/amino acid:cation symporter [Pseudomonadota bacterium]